MAGLYVPMKFRRGEPLSLDGDTHRYIYRVRSGVAGRFLRHSNHRRQITALYLPGDWCDPTWIFDEQTRSNIVALCPTLVERVAIEDIISAHVKTEPSIALFLKMVIDAVRVQDQKIARLGRLSAAERLTSVIIDIQRRVTIDGDGNHGFAMPLTQLDLADYAGMTAVHVHRIVKKLRKLGIVTIRNHHWYIADTDRLQHISTGQVML